MSLYKSAGITLDMKHIEVMIAHIFRDKTMKGLTKMTRDKSLINHLSIGYYDEAIFKSLTEYSDDDEIDRATSIATGKYF